MGLRQPIMNHFPARGPRAGAVLLGAALLLTVPTVARAQSSTGYRIGPKDLIEIKVFEVPELNIERRVSEEGTINLPLIGDVPVKGLTDVELAARLKALLESKYVQRASVSVQVREFRSAPISVIGAVKQPGNLAFSGRWTLLEALSAAGGLTEDHGDKIYVLRRAENGLSDQISDQRRRPHGAGRPGRQPADLRQRHHQRPGQGRDHRVLPRRGQATRCGRRSRAPSGSPC